MSSWRRIGCFIATAMCAVSLAFTQTAPQLQQQGQAAMAAGRFAEAADSFAKWARLAPGSPAPWFQLGLASYQASRYADASAALEKTIRLDPRNTPARAFLGLSEAAQGRHTQALPHLEIAFRAKESEPPPELRRLAGIQLAKAYSLAQRTLDAEAVVIELLRAFPDDEDVLYSATWLHLTEGRALMSRLARRAPEAWRTRLLLGRLLLESDNLDGAAQQFRRALEANPQAPGPNYELGRIALRKSNAEPAALAEAQGHFEQELRLDPRHSPSLRGLGDIALARQKADEALRLFDRALEADPQSAESHVGLCRLHLQSDHTTPALNHCQKAAELDPRASQPHFYLARLYRKLGRDADAKRETALFDKLKTEALNESQLFGGARLGTETR